MLTSDTYIFIDTCSLLVSCWDMSRDNTIVYNQKKDRRFWDGEVPTLAQIGTIILTKRNYDELNKLSSVHNDPKRPQLGERCSQVLSRITPLLADKTISIAGDPNDPFADAILLSVALKFRTQKNLLFLTQDRALASDLIAISNFQSVRPRNGYELKVRRLNAEGRIDHWHFSNVSGGWQAKSHSKQKSKSILPGKSKQESDQLSKHEWWRLS